MSELEIRCSTCKEVKLSSEFYKSKDRRPYGFTSQCKLCTRQRLDNAKYPDRNRKDRFRRGNLRRKFGITVEEYEIMYQEQEGKCKICGKEEWNIHHATGEPQRLAVDHCKETGKVRGLLCALCNKGIGSLLHDKQILLSAIQYLRDTS